MDTGGIAASFMLAQANGQKNAEEIVEKLDVLSKTLRAKAMSNFLQYRKAWEPSWQGGGEEH